MSTGLDCRFFERTPGEWWLVLDPDNGAVANSGANGFRYRMEIM